MHHTILFKNLHSNFIYIPSCTTKLPFSDSASLLLYLRAPTETGEPDKENGHAKVMEPELFVICHRILQFCPPDLRIFC